MEQDLLFTLIPKANWKNHAENGQFKPESLDLKGFIVCYEAKEVELAANQEFIEEKNLYLLIIDPLRINVPIKKVEENGIPALHLYGSFSIDAVIDRIVLKKNSKDKFFVHIKHFD